MLPDRLAATSSISRSTNLAFRVDGRVGGAVAMNGTIPGPLIRLREGQEAVLRVTNHLQEITSNHWHGLILPPEMDGVPGVSFAGTQPGEVGFRLRYEIRREYAPYVGMAYRQTFGWTRERVRREGGNPNEVQFVFGVRTWS